MLSKKGNRGYAHNGDRDQKMGEEKSTKYLTIKYI